MTNNVFAEKSKTQQQPNNSSKQKYLSDAWIEPATSGTSVSSQLRLQLNV